MTTPANLGQYPYAISDGQLAHIQQATPGPGYACPGCRNPMEAVRESHVPPHFRHTRPLDCDQQEALRKAAIGLIEQFAEDAQRDGRPYEVTFRCETCHRLKLQQDLAVPGTTITTDDEETLPPLRLVASLGTRALILNLVIGNEPDPEIEDIRQYFDIPVLTLKVVSFDSLQYLRSGFIAEGGINTSGLCRECEGLRDGEISREDRSLPDREEAQEMLEWMISQDCTQPMKPVEIPFEFLPEEIQAELLNLPQGYRDPVSLKLCSQCSMPAILYQNLVVWTGAGSLLGTASTVTHLNCFRQLPLG